MIRLLIAGSRDFNNYDVFSKIVNEYISLHNMNSETDIILSGGAPGVDSLAELYAKNNGYHFIKYSADWSLGKRAGPFRNQEMAKHCDCALIFWNSCSRGTRNMISNLNKLNIPTTIKYIDSIPKILI